MHNVKNVCEAKKVNCKQIFLLTDEHGKNEKH